MRVQLDRMRAAGVLARLAPEPRKRVKAVLSLLGADPYPSNAKLEAKRLERAPDKEAVYRAQVGHWRIVYVVRGPKVLVIRIMRRDEGYEWLD